MTTTETEDLHEDAASPRLRPEIPLIWRAPGRVHFGDDDGRTPMTHEEADWLASLDRFQTWSAARAACPSGGPRADRIVGHARQIQAIDEPDECWWMSPNERAMTRPELLALAYWHPQPSQAMAARANMNIAVQGDSSVADALRRTLSECGLPSRDDRSPDITVVATIGHVDVIDPHDDEAMPAHLPVRVHYGRASIGPLVIPGRTPCCRCLALHLRDRDPHWPAIASQWRGHEVRRTSTTPVDQLLVQRVAVESVSFLRRWVDAAQNDGGIRVHLAVPEMATRVETIAAHAGCGCLWQSPSDS